MVLWAALCLVAAVYLFIGNDIARLIAGIVALVGFLFSIPVAVAGGVLYALLLAVGCGAALYLVWDNQWNNFLAPVGIMGILSISLGLLFTFPASPPRIRQSIIGPNAPPETADVVRRVLEADQRAAFVTVLYLFVFLMALLMGYLFMNNPIRRTRQMASPGTMLSGLGRYRARLHHYWQHQPEGCTSGCYLQVGQAMGSASGRCPLLRGY